MKQPFELTPQKSIHFVGIGGAGMGGIAEVLLNQGFTVTGSDVNQNAMTKRLTKLGAHINRGHRALQIEHADVVVISSAIGEENPEVVAAKKAGIPTIPRAQMLAALMDAQHGIAIAGTHGKTTTTGILASILTQAGLDPTFVMGGLLHGADTNARLGSSEFFVAEADESDASFLYLQPRFAVVTNIDADHLPTYDDDFEQLKQTFVKFLHNLPEDGLAIVCIDDPVIRELLPQIRRPLMTYGFSEDAMLRLEHYQQDHLQGHFRVHDEKGAVDIILNMPGRHNALNAAACIAVARVLQVDNAAITQALQQFAGTGRRFQLHGDITVAGRRVTLVDDYGHHPREVEVTLEAARAAWPKRRIVMVYQPHRYTRTQRLFDDFVEALSAVDELILLEVYAASEQPIAGADGKTLCNAIQQRGDVPCCFVPDIDNLPQAFADVLRDDDVLLLQGAGSIGRVSADLVPC